MPTQKLNTIDEIVDWIKNQLSRLEKTGDNLYKRCERIERNNQNDERLYHMHIKSDENKTKQAVLSALLKKINTQTPEIKLDPKIEAKLRKINDLKNEYQMLQNDVADYFIGTISDETNRGENIGIEIIDHTVTDIDTSSNSNDINYSRRPIIYSKDLPNNAKTEKNIINDEPVVIAKKAIIRNVKGQQIDVIRDVIKKTECADDRILITTNTDVIQVPKGCIITYAVNDIAENQIS